MPHCDTCGEAAPYGDERNLWLGWHESRTHRLAQRLMRAVGRLGHRKNAKKPKQQGLGGKR